MKGTKNGYAVPFCVWLNWANVVGSFKVDNPTRTIEGKDEYMPLMLKDIRGERTLSHRVFTGDSDKTTSNGEFSPIGARIVETT